MNIKNILIAIILTLIVILLSYLSSKHIEQIVKERAQEIKIEKNNSTQEKIYSEKIKNGEKINLTQNNTYNLSESFLNIGNIGIKSERFIEKENLTKILNYTKFEEAYIFDFCFSEEILSIEGKNLICLNEIPKNIKITINNNKIRIIYNDILSREIDYKEKILLGYAFAKDFYGVEGEIIEFFTNSTFAFIEKFELGEISYLNETIVYASFPIYINTEKIDTEDLHIFVRTSMKNYLISSIKILVI